MKLYTRTGDQGQTSLIGGRVSKDDIRVESYGTIDELNSFIGLAAAELENKITSEIKEELFKIQLELFDCGGELANVSKTKEGMLKEEYVEFLEQRIDEYTKEAPPLERFILPGGSKASAYVHAARTIARRAERQIVRLMNSEEIPSVTLKYINRLSDYLFAVARVINFRLHVKDVEYERGAIVFRDRDEKEE
ncbi:MULTISPECIES: cob(I)yrinic acid a,c-diamide adenosyltransferase [Bacillus]|uniref:Corrinoid adenosyltransferase n=2 Tax=Bacillus TaxID=1386 RepID=A0A0M4FYD3_9BACI|nr:MULTISPECIES: cob(I)yrinic acid a,c-diamide adenosyltransferase [Bacillus]ALC82325.1 cobalamin adenosyltransferase [Bacillus gobiensis]MBP1081191.1 cob(I)alamin adenosyltransferase [Bacillus capparidis]MED1095872.1 cob(I)yrinic acid a,c-diamide adenosyltransferase [Bacillus capparidis]